MDSIKEVAGIVEKGGNNKIPKIKPKHQLFINHYINTHNVAESVRLCNYKAKDPSRTGNNLMKRPEIVLEIARREAELQKALVKDRPQFLLDLQDLKKRAKEKGRIDTELKAMVLEADILGLTAPEQQQQINVFSALDSARTFLEGREDKKPSEDIAQAVIVEPEPSNGKQSTSETANDTTQMGATHMSDHISTLSGEVITIEPENRGEG